MRLNFIQSQILYYIDQFKNFSATSTSNGWLIELVNKFGKSMYAIDKGA